MRAAIGESPAYLWVAEGNPRALAFYLKHGFRPDGKRGQLPPEWESLPEFRMVRAIMPGPALSASLRSAGCGPGGPAG